MVYSDINKLFGTTNIDSFSHYVACCLAYLRFVASSANKALLYKSRDNQYIYIGR